MIPDMPTFLHRTPGDTKPVPKEQKPILFGPAAQKQIDKNHRRNEKLAVRPKILQAIMEGADTFGKIRLMSGVEVDPYIRSALRVFIKRGHIQKVGRRYYPNRWS